MLFEGVFADKMLGSVSLINIDNEENNILQFKTLKLHDDKQTSKLFAYY